MVPWKEGRRAKDKLFTCLIVVLLIVMVHIICMALVCWVWTKTSVFTSNKAIARAHTLHGYMLWLLSPALTGEKRKTGGSKMVDCPSNYLTAGSLPWHRVLANSLSGQLVAIVRRLNERRYKPWWQREGLVNVGRSSVLGQKGRKLRWLLGESWCWGEQPVICSVSYVCQVSQFDLHTGLGHFGLGPNGHGDHLGVHHCMVPEAETDGQTDRTKSNLLRIHFSLWIQEKKKSPFSPL